LGGHEVCTNVKRDPEIGHLRRRRELLTLKRDPENRPSKAQKELLTLAYLRYRVGGKKKESSKAGRRARQVSFVKVLCTVEQKKGKKKK
jgi:hypothetical protein